MEDKDRYSDEELREKLSPEEYARHKKAIQKIQSQGESKKIKPLRALLRFLGL